MNRMLFKTIVALSLSLLAIIGTTPPTSANDRNLVDRLIEVFPSLEDVPEEEILSDFKNQAEEAGLPPDRFLAQIIEATRLNDEAMRRATGERDSKDPNRIETRAAYPKLPDSYYKGDIYISPSVHVIDHGHTGIYGDTYWVVEASGPGTLSNWHYTNEIAGPSGTKLFETTLSQHAQNLAADYAYTSLRGYPYPTVPTSTRNLHPNTLTCSQLVWLAYLRTTGVDLDGSESIPGFIFPYDIEESPYTKQNWEVR